MDEQLGAMYADVVRLVNRTKDVLSFGFDGRNYEVAPGPKGMMTPRFMAEHAIVKNPVRVGFGGLVEESLFGIEGSEQWPTDPLDYTSKDIEEQPKVEVDGMTKEGKPAKSKKISLKPQRENFSDNNL